MAELFGIPNIEYIGGGIGILIIFVLIWFALKGRSGRLGEERAEENETVQLLKDERVVEKDERDEKKQCKILDGLFSDIMIILRNSGNSNLADQLMDKRMRISKILKDELSEKMSVKTALQNFYELHALINEFLAKLPKDNPQINMLVEEIKKHHQRHYKDLIEELNMDRDKMKQLKKLWAQTLDEERGQGKLQSV